MQYELRPATSDDYDFLYHLLVATMKDYVDQTWGWEEAYQQQRFRQKFTAQEYQIVVHGGADVGAVSVIRRAEDVRLNEIQIAPAWQRKGLGTAIIQDLVTVAAEFGMPVSLQVLKVNPARRLYERLGFELTAETDAHYQMIYRVNTRGELGSPH